MAWIFWMVVVDGQTSWLVVDHVTQVVFETTEEGVVIGDAWKIDYIHHPLLHCIPLQYRILYHHHHSIVHHLVAPVGTREWSFYKWKLLLIDHRWHKKCQTKIMRVMEHWNARMLDFLLFSLVYWKRIILQAADSSSFG